MIDPQLAIVLVIVAVAALYAGRAFLRQFWVSEDEPGGCATCASNESEPTPPVEDGAGLVGLSRSGSKRR